MNHYRFEDIYIGQKEEFRVTVTEQMMKQFLEITDDVNPLHNDEVFAKKNGYPDRVVYGMLTASFLSTLAGVYLPGEKSLIHSVESKFVKPVYVGDVLTVSGQVAELYENFRTFKMKTVIRNQNGEKILRGTMQIGILDSDSSL